MNMERLSCSMDHGNAAIFHLYYDKIIRFLSLYCLFAVFGGESAFVLSLSRIYAFDCRACLKMSLRPHFEIFQNVRFQLLHVTENSRTSRRHTLRQPSTRPGTVANLLRPACLINFKTSDFLRGWWFCEHCQLIKKPVPLVKSLI